MTLAPPCRTAAFFDLDHTLLSRSSGELYVRVLRQRGEISPRDLMTILAASVLYRLNMLEPERLMDRAARRYAGAEEEQMIRFCRRWFHESVRKHLYVEAVERVRQHQRDGHTVALLTAATNYVAEPAGEYLGIPHRICTRLHVDGGRFTGSIVKPICHGKGKVYWAERFSKTQGLDLSSSYFYTDSIRDIPALEAVGHPRPVNPDRLLLRAARRRGWPVERFRKTLGAEGTA